MKKNLENLSDISTKILIFGLPIVIGYFIYLIIAFNSHTDVSRHVLIHIYTPQLEYITSSLVILVLGALLFDITEKEMNNEKK
jgi:hypothetical protein